MLVPAFRATASGGLKCRVFEGPQLKLFPPVVPAPGLPSIGVALGSRNELSLHALRLAARGDDNYG